MSAWHDWVDWVGGLPFEVSTPDGIIDPLQRAGFTLETLKTVGNGWGCNEFVFRRGRCRRVGQCREDSCAGFARIRDQGAGTKSGTRFAVFG